MSLKEELKQTLLTLEPYTVEARFAGSSELTRVSFKLLKQILHLEETVERVIQQLAQSSQHQQEQTEQVKASQEIQQRLSQIQTELRKEILHSQDAAKQQVNKSVEALTSEVRLLTSQVAEWKTEMLRRLQLAEQGQQSDKECIAALDCKVSNQMAVIQHSVSSSQQLSREAMDKVQTVNTCLDSIQESVRSITTQVDSAQSHIQVVQGQVGDAKQQVTSVKEQVTSVKEQVEFVKDHVDTVKSSVESVKSSVDIVKSSVAAEHLTLRHQMEKLEQQMQDLVKQASESKQESSSAQIVLSDEKDSDSASSDNSAATVEVQLQDKLVELQVAFDHINSRLDKMREQVETWQKRDEERAQRIQALNDLITNLQQQKEKAPAKKISDLATRMDAVERIVADLVR